VLACAATLPTGRRKTFSGNPLQMSN